MKRFSGKVAFITGAAQGIGRAIAEKFLSEGARLVFLDVEAGPIQKALKEMAAGGGQVKAVKGDVSKRADVRRALKLCLKSFGRLDILVSNAGIAGGAPLLEFKDSDWQRTLDVNLTGVFNCVQEAARVMAPKRKGAIVVTASTNAFWVEANMAAYNASKGGVVAFVRTAALDLAEYGIRVNAVEPGVTRTRLAAIVTEDPKLAPDYLKHIPLNRFAETKEIADAVAFLASDEASYITGHSLIVDGGMTVGLPAAQLVLPWKK